MAGFALFNASIERVAYRPLRHAPRLSPLITAVGMSFIVNNIGLAIYGVNYQTVPNFIPRTDLIHIGDVSYSWSKASVLFIVIPLLVVLSWFVRSTKQGKAMRAVAAGHRGLGDDGHRREPDDLRHVPARRSACGRRRASSTCCSSTCATTPGSSSA